MKRKILQCVTKTEDVKKTTHKNDLILPHQPYHDDFLDTITRLFHWAKWIGIIGMEHPVWKLWGLIVLVLYLSIEVEAIWKVVKIFAGWAVDTAGRRSTSSRLSGAIFYTSSLLGAWQCWKLSCSWRDLCKHWASVEWSLSIKVPSDASLKRRMYLTIGGLVACTVFEHSLNILSCMDLSCKASECLRKFILHSHAFLILNNEYSDWIGVIVLYMSIMATIVWNLQDLLIVLISMGLTSRYRRLNECVANFAEKNKNGKKWREDTEFLKVYLWRKIREAYVKQSKLVRRFDKSLGRLILISASFNFYFICLQLFLAIRQEWEQVPLKQAYYAVSTIWVAVRTACTVVAAADVSKHSTMALPYLYECNAQCYNVEIERLQKQLINDFVALSGMGFFYLDRTVVLQMSGAVVTYVLVLIQYDDGDEK